MVSGFPQSAVAPDGTAGGRRWVALAALLLVVSIGSWLALVIALGLEGNVCFDVKRLPDTQRLCDVEHRRVADAWRLVIIVAVVSAALMLLVGVFEGVQRLRFASGTRHPLRVLAFVSPAGFLGYALGHVLGRLLPPLGAASSTVP
jgi:hypothetical protein